MGCEEVFGGACVLDFQGVIHDKTTFRYGRVIAIITVALTVECIASIWKGNEAKP